MVFDHTPARERPYSYAFRGGRRGHPRAQTARDDDQGLPVAATALDVAFLAMDGALFYGALRATGTLWVPILLHGIGDFARFMQQGGEDDTGAETFGNAPADAVVEYLLIGLSIALVVSLARDQIRTRRARKTEQDKAVEHPAVRRNGG